MMRNSILFHCLVFLTSLPAISQQTPSFSEYNYNPYLLNSAYAGVQDVSEATLSTIGFGNQDFDGSPRSLSFTFNSSFKSKKMGLGFGIVDDEIGVTSTTQIYGTYSYRVILNDNAHPYWKVFDRSFISFGLNVGVLMYNQDLLSLGIQNDPNFSENISSTLSTMGAGILFGYRNFFTGISIPNLLGDSIQNQEELKLSTPFYGYSGYHFVLNKYAPKFILKPSMLFKYERGAPFQIDANLALSFKNIVELGAGLRTANTLNAFIGLNILKNFRTVYSYSQGGGDSPIRNTHGIILSYRGGNGFETL